MLVRSLYSTTSCRPFLSYNEKLFIYNNDGTINVKEASTSNLERSILPFNIKDTKIDGVCISGSQLIGYTFTGNIYGFDLDKTFNIFRISKKINRKSNISIWETRSSDGLYFLLINNTSSLYVFYGSTSYAYISNNEIRLNKAQWQLDKSTASKTFIKSIQHHPTKSFLLFSMSSGPTQVWSYSDLKTKLSIINKDTDYPYTNSLGDDNIDNLNNNDIDDNNDGVGGKLKYESKDNTLSIYPALLLQPPTTNSDSSATNTNGVFAFISKSISISSDGSLVAIIWNNINNTCNIIAIYDIRQFNLLNGVSSSGRNLLPLCTYRASSSCDLISVSFHPYEPILLVLVKEDYRSSSIWALSLLEPSMSMVGEQKINIQDPDSITITPMSSTILISHSSALNSSNTILYHVTAYLLSSFWSTEFSMHRVCVSHLFTPSNAFSEGDQVLIKGTTNNSNRWPLIFTIQSSIEVSDTGLLPLRMSYKMYRLQPISNNIRNNKGGMNAIHMGNIAYTVAPKSQPPQLGIEPSGLIFSSATIPFDGIFIPLSVSTGQYLLTDNYSSDNSAWIALIKGLLLAPSSITVSGGDSSGYDDTEREYHVTPKISMRTHIFCLVFGKSSGIVNCVQGHYRAATILTNKGNNNDNDGNILVLSANGNQIKLLSVVHPGGGSIMYTWDLSSIASQMWPSYIFNAKTGGDILMLWGKSINQTSLSIPSFTLSSPTIIMTDVSHIHLSNQEQPLEVVWQPEIIKINEDHTDKALVGIRTDYRVLILNTHPVLEICNQIPLTDNISIQSSYLSHNIKKNKPNDSMAGTMGSVSSLTWVNNILLLASDRGGIRYMLPKSNTNIPISNDNIPASVMNGIFSNYTIKKTKSVTSKRLFSLPFHQSAGGTLQIITALPDRIIYAYMNTGLYTTSQICICMRPFIPLEPLIAGMTMKTNSLKRDSQLPIETTLSQIIISYCPSRRQPGQLNLENGAQPSSQITKYITSILAERGYSRLAAFVAGICPDPRSGTGFDFPWHRMFPSGFKFYLAICCGKYEEACVELLCGHPELQEAFLDPESVIGSSLPHKDSSIGEQIKAAALILLMCGQVNISRRLADLAGDDTFITTLLVQNNDISQLTQLSQELDVHKIHSYTSIIVQKLTQPKSNDLYNKYTNISHIGGSDRRTSIMKIPSNNYDNKENTIIPSIDLNNLLKDQKVFMTERSGGIGPITSLGLGLLAADVLEDWLGRSKPEVLESKNTNGGVTERIEQITFDNNVDRPIGWVDGVGEGKDWDRVVGYWRFSDIVREGEEGYNVSGNDVICLLPDLSKYSQMMEVYRNYNSTEPISLHTNNILQLEESTSSVDPGEDHEKVKRLNDVVFPNTCNDKVCLGLRVEVLRGSALDVGPCCYIGTEANRGKLTLEVCVAREVLNENESIDSMTTNTGPVCVLRRTIDKPQHGTNHSDKLLWGIWVDNDGAVYYGISPTESEYTLKTDPGVITMNSEFTKWSHIAVVLDGTSQYDSKRYVASIFIDGVRCKRTVLSLPPLLEAELAVSWIELGPELQGTGYVWRLTELRIWVDSRSTSDLEGQRDNYLHLASKRKRLQFRIKGSKKLFGPPPSSLSLIIGSDPSSNNKPVPKNTSSSFDISGDAFSAFASTPGQKSTLLPMNNSLVPPQSNIFASSAGVGTLPLASTNMFASTPGGSTLLKGNTKISGSLPLPTTNVSNAAAKRRSLLAQKPTQVPPPIPRELPNSIDSDMKINKISNSNLSWEVLIQGTESSILSTSSELSITNLTQSYRNKLLVPSYVLNRDGSSGISIALRLSSEQILLISYKIIHSSQTNLNTNQRGLVTRNINVTSDDVLVGSNINSDGYGDLLHPNLTLLLSNPQRLGLWQWDAGGKAISGQITTLLPMSANLVYWTSIRDANVENSQSYALLLVTSGSVFRWRPLAANGKNRPIKIFDRIDISDPQKINEYRIRDVQLFSTEILNQSKIQHVENHNMPTFQSFDIAMLSSKNISSAAGIISFYYLDINTGLCSNKILLDADSACFGFYQNNIDKSSSCCWVVKDDIASNTITIVQLPIDTSTGAINTNTQKPSWLGDYSSKNSSIMSLAELVNDVRNIDNNVWIKTIRTTSPSLSSSGTNSSEIFIRMITEFRLAILSSSGELFILSAKSGDLYHTIPFSIPEPILSGCCIYPKDSNNQNETVIIVVGSQTGTLFRLNFDKFP